MVVVSFRFWMCAVEVKEVQNVVDQAEWALVVRGGEGGGLEVLSLSISRSLLGDDSPSPFLPLSLI